MASATPTALDVRADFPILSREFDGHPLVYLDSSNTSQKPSVVIDAIDDYYRRHNANIHRAVYTLGQEATDMFEGARARIAAFCGADRGGTDPRATILTRNATEAINLVAYAWGRDQRRSRRCGADHPDGAPLEYRPVAAAVRRA